MTVLQQGNRLRRKIEERTGSPIADLRHFATGQNANLYLVDLDDERRLIAKEMRYGEGDDPAGNVTLEAEGWMLEYLARKTKLPLPKVVWYDATTILMEFIEGSGVMNNRVQEHAAELLADLHAIKGDFFGLERDTVTGTSLLPNPYETDWVVFYRDHRLLYMAREALKEDMLDNALMRRIEKLAGRLDEYIDSTVSPGLVHGDLWGGNVLLGQGKINAFLDPAMYFADPEVELAAIRLFDTFGDPFFARYHEISPIRPGFHEVRRHIYSLYPLLVNARHFGRRYADAASAIVQRFVG